MTLRTLIILILLPVFTQPAYAEDLFSCGVMPSAVTEVNRDVKSDISVSVGSIGKARAVNVGAKTEIEAQNLFSKYPDVDRILTLQMMSSTYCTMLRSSKISDSEKLDRWERFQDKILALKSPSASSVSSVGISTSSVKSNTSTPKTEDEWVDTRNADPTPQDTLTVATEDLIGDFSKPYCGTHKGNIQQCNMTKESCDANKIFGCNLRPETFFCYAQQEIGKPKVLNCSYAQKTCTEDFNLSVTVRNMYKKQIRFSYGCFEIRPPRLQ